MIIIGIAGGSGAGKTTVARTIAERIGEKNVNYLSQDWYYRDHSHMTLEERKRENMDHPNAFENDLLVSHLKTLKQGKPIEVPIYDYTVNTRDKSRTVHMSTKAVTILEGILVLAVPELCSLLDFRIFVDADPDIRLIRRLKRDVNERGSTFEDTIRRYLLTVKPMHEAFIEPSKRNAHIIVPRGGENEMATEVLVDLVKNYIKKE